MSESLRLTVQMRMKDGIPIYDRVEVEHDPGLMLYFLTHPSNDFTKPLGTFRLEITPLDDTARENVLPRKRVKAGKTFTDAHRARCGEPLSIE